MIKLFKNWYLRHFSQPGTVEFAIVLLAAFLIVYYLMWLVGPLVVALCLAYCLDWGVRGLMRRFGLSRVWSSSIVMFIFISFAISILLWVVPRVVQQGSLFYNSVQSYAADALEVKQTESNLVISPYVQPEELSAQDLDTMLAGKLHELIKELPDPVSSMFTQQELQGYVESAHKSILNNIAQILREHLMPSVMNVMTWAMYMIIVPIFMFLMLMNKRVLQKRFTTYILPTNQVLIHEFWPKLNAQMEGYIRGKALHILIIAIVNTTVFIFFDLNYALLLGIGVGLSVVIPYVGAVLIAIPFALISMLQFGFSTALLWIWAAYLLIQLLDSNLLTPMLFSKAMNLDAFSILAAILIFGGLWGFWGVFFSIPLATLIRTLVVQWPDLAESSAQTDGTQSADPGIVSQSHEVKADPQPHSPEVTPRADGTESE